MSSSHNQEPDAFAVWASHALVGLGVSAVTQMMFGPSKALSPEAIVVGLAFGFVAVLIHAALDAPVADLLSDAGL